MNYLPLFLSDNKGAEDKLRLKKRSNSDSVLYCPRKDEDTKHNDGKLEEVKQWERSAFVWKMGKYLENLPEPFRESSEMSDSGVSTQSVFSELQSEEGKGDYYLFICLFIYFILISLPTFS